MKKDLIFAPILLLVGVLLCLLKVTGITAHIVISLVGVVALVAYTVAAKKQWKIPALEIIMRAFYGIALISGVVIKVNLLPVFAIIHKVSAILFALLLIALFIHKLFVKKV